jgi:probable rRNA maturation factor
MPPAYEIVIANRQRTKRLDRRILKQIAEFTLHSAEVESAELGFHFVSAKKMACVHKEFMDIEGSTDVITFDHGSNPPKSIHGEIFISIQDAIKQAQEFKSTWQSEITRYIIHGILHLLGYDDLIPAARTKMKREENRLLKAFEKQVAVSQIHPTS